MKSRTNSSTANNISSVVYNHLGLAESIAATAGTTTYTYDASGRKLRTVFGSTATDYIDGIEYEDGTMNFIHMEEGRIVNTGVGFEYEYFLRDHLGNTRSGFKASTPTVASVKSDYYPFGLQYQSGIVAGSPNNKYLYNGKELQDGTKLYDYGARLYDPIIGRWGAVDPMAEGYYSLTPYQYGGNTPINTIDVDGRLFIFVNGFIPGEWLPTRLPGSVPNQYGTYTNNFKPYAVSSMDRGFSTSDRFNYWGNGLFVNNYNETFQDKNNLFVNASYTPSHLQK